MEPVQIRRLSGFLKKIRKKLDRNFFIFMIFLFLSGLFWLLNELSREAIADISYPVKYINLPGNKMLANEVPKRLNLKLRAPGYTLIRFKLSSGLIPLNLDMESYFLRQLPGKNSSDYYLLTRELRGRFERRLSSTITIIDIQPDSLFFKFDSIIYKKVPVTPSVEYTMARQFMLRDEFQTTPDSIVVSGPGLVLDTLKAVSTKAVNFIELNTSVEQEIKLKPIPRVEFNNETVFLFAAVEQFTEASLKVHIKAINVPDSLVLKTFPNQVSLTCNAGLSDYDKVSAHVFQLEVDYQDIGQSLGGKLKVNIASAPEFVRYVRIHPLYVEFIIEKK